MVQINNSILVSGALALCTILVGCNQSLNAIAPTAPPRALPSTPAEPVATGQLPPITADAQQVPPVAAAPTTPENAAPIPGDIASADTPPTSSSVAITREGMAGSWQVPTDGSGCRIILAFTKWSGGYRAATRKCNSPEIQTVNAWDVKDQSVVLVDQSGNEVARLFGTQNGHYSGRTKSGKPVSFTR